MTADRKRRKKNKLRGQRTMGAGSTKNRRGAGSRGGRGNAGANKHRFHSIGRLKTKKFRFKAKIRGRTINLGQLDRQIDMLIAKGKVTEKSGKVIVDKKSGYSKVLGEGETKRKITLKINASADAIKKIIAAGGSFEFAKKGVASDEVVMSGDADDEDLEFETVETDEPTK